MVAHVLVKQIRKGFTLIEILVVISIIGILASIAAVAYSSAQKQARDSRRASDLQAIQHAFEQYYNDNDGSYPSSVSAAATALSSYLPAGIPNDPKTGTSYTANASVGVSSYYFRATLDNTTGGNSNSSTCGTFSASGQFFCVKNLQ